VRRSARPFRGAFPLRGEVRGQACGGRQIGRQALLFFERELGHERLGFEDHALLLLRIGEPAPVVHFAQIAHARCDFLELRAQSSGGVVEVLTIVRGRFIERRANVFQEPFAFLQRDLVGFGDALGALGHPLHFGEQVQPGLVFRFLRLVVAAGKDGGDGVEPVGEIGGRTSGVGQDGGEAARLAHEGLPSLGSRRRLLKRRQRLSGHDERLEFGASLVEGGTQLVACAARGHRHGESLGQSRGLRAVPDEWRERSPFFFNGLQLCDGVIAVQGLDAHAQCFTGRERFGALPAQFLGFFRVAARFVSGSRGVTAEARAT